MTGWRERLEAAVALMPQGDITTCLRALESAEGERDDAQRRLRALREQVDQEGCVAAHYGERTYECSASALCGLCRLRGRAKKAERERDEWRLRYESAMQIAQNERERAEQAANFIRPTVGLGPKEIIAGLASEVSGLVAQLVSANKRISDLEHQVEARAGEVMATKAALTEAQEVIALLVCGKDSVEPKLVERAGYACRAPTPAAAALVEVWRAARHVEEADRIANKHCCPKCQEDEMQCDDLGRLLSARSNTEEALVQAVRKARATMGEVINISISDNHRATITEVPYDPEVFEKLSQLPDKVTDLPRDDDDNL